MRDPRRTDELLRDVRLDLFLSPTDTEPFSDADILSVADRIQLQIWTHLLTQDYESLTTLLDIHAHTKATLIGGIIATIPTSHPNEFQIPSDAMLRLVSISWVVDGEEQPPLTQVSDQSEPYFRHWDSAGTPQYVAVRGNTVRIFPFPSSTEGKDYRVRVRYVARPLILKSGTGGAVNLGNGMYSGRLNLVGGLPDDEYIRLSYPDFDASAGLTGVPGAILSSAAPHVVVEAYPTGALSGPFAETLLVNKSLVWGWSNDDSNPTRTRVGDFICLSYETDVVQVPHDLYPALVDGVVAKLARGRHDSELFQPAAQEYAQGLYGARLRPRVVGQGRTASNTQSFGSRRARGTLFRGRR